MKKFLPIKIITLIFCLAALPSNAKADDDSSSHSANMTNGVWKSLNEIFQPEDGDKNLISGFASNRIYYTNTYDSSNQNREYSDTFLKTKLGLKLRLNSNFSIKTVGKLDKVQKASEVMGNNQLKTGSKDNFFENEGAYLDELVLNYNYKNFSALLGKLQTNFGSAWKSSNGIWVNEIGKIYDQNEKLGFGVIERAGDKKTIGEYVFGFSAFTNDRKNLDKSIITNRDSDIKSDGMVGDTRSLRSYVASMDIYYQFSQKENLSYHFSYSNLAVNYRQNQTNIPSKVDDQKSFAINMNYQYPVMDNVLLNGFVEYANLNNFGGNVDKKAGFLTVNLTANINDFYMTIARGKEKQFEAGMASVDSYIDEVSVGYKFDHLSPMLKNLSLAVGYNKRENNISVIPSKDSAFGFLLSHKAEF